MQAAAAGCSKAKHSRTIPLVSTTIIGRRISFSVGSKSTCPWRDKHWPAHLMSPAVHHLSSSAIGSLSAPDHPAPCLLVAAPRLLWRRFSCARCFSSSHLFPDLAMLHPPTNSLSNPATGLYWTGTRQAGKLARQSGLDWNGKDRTCNLKSMALMSMSLS